MSKKCDIVLGGQWGDEGKAKIIDYLSADYDIICRFQGGANAGHTVVANNQKYVFHLIPSGILYPQATCVLANGLVIDINEVLKELKDIKEKGINYDGRIKISSLAFVVLPFHIALDKAREKMSGGKIGTTCRGIGPAYLDKYFRNGIHIGDLADKELLKQKITDNIVEKKVLFDHYFDFEYDFDVDKIVADAQELYAQIKDYVIHSPYYLNEAMQDGKSILMEGAQGAGLDINFGSYPYVTSSPTTSGGVVSGTGIGINNYGNVTGVFKAYITRVGGGALPTILNEEEGKVLQKYGNEFGATTGRPRDCGWFDGVQGKYSTMINGLTEIALTKIDIFDHYDKVKFCTGYKINGKETNQFPVTIEEFNIAEPIYREFDGWDKPTAGVKEYKDLPDNAKRYLDFFSDYLKCPIKYVSNGPDRLDTIVV